MRLGQSCPSDVGSNLSDHFVVGVDESRNNIYTMSRTNGMPNSTHGYPIKPSLQVAGGSLISCCYAGRLVEPPS